MIGLLELSQAAIEYRDLGASTKPALVFIHGAPSSYDDLSSSARIYLESHYRVITYNRPGFGNSTSSQRLILVDHAKILNDLLKSLDISEATFLAHSLGSRILLEYLTQYRPRKGTAVLISPFLQSAKSEKSREGLLNFLRKGWGGRIALSILANTLGRKGIEKNIRDSSFPRDIDLTQLEQSIFRYSLPQTILEIMEEKESLAGTPLPRSLPASIEFLVIGNDQDRIAPLNAQTALLLSMGANLQIVPDSSVGHLLSHISGPLLKRSFEKIQPIKGEINHASAQGI